MKITCICPTHGRAHVIGEAVESFTRQDYDGDAELLIVNDCPEQPLSCNAHGVRIINLPEPITDASCKFNLSVGHAKGEFIAWWEDDDISLPHRLRMSLAMIDAYGVDYLKPERAFFWDGGTIKDRPINLFFGACMFRRTYWQECGGAKHGESPDASAHQAMIYGGKFAIPDLPADQTWFVYRWGGVAVSHDSGVAGDGAARFAAFRERTLAHPRFRPGTQTITPAWRRDYAAQVAEYIGRAGNA